jgi:two-component system, OmpR family, phosphate regulon response regulator PhoB
MNLITAPVSMSAGLTGLTGLNVLVVDDDPDIRTLIEWQLEADGCSVVPAGDAATALAILTSRQIGIVVLDLCLPDLGGLDVLCHIRRTSGPPVIILSGRTGETDRVLGLDLGADDYMTKPLSPTELSSRIRAVMRRVSPPEKTMLAFGDLHIDLGTREVVANRRVVEMAPKEFEVLAFLAQSPRKTYSREQLLQHVWQSSSGWHDQATVTQHIYRVRHKIEPDPNQPRWVKTVSRVGYRFEP